MTFHSFARRVARGAGLAVGLSALLPAAASAHQLTGRYESPLPLAAYLGGAAVAVALSFAIVILRGRSRAADGTETRATAAPTGAERAPTGAERAPTGAERAPTGDGRTPTGDERTPTGDERLIHVPGWFRLAVRGLGLIAWLWILIEGVVGGTSADTDAGSLFLWTYGWVALPILSAFLGPVWEWLDPFATLHDLGAAAFRRLGRPGWPTIPYPAGLQRWPAAAAFAVFIWLELVYTSARGGQVLAITLVLYTAWTLAMMAQFGRDTWRRNGELFTVWLGILNRIAPLAPADESAATLRARGFGQGLLQGTWLPSELVVVALGTASILFDGLSQTQVWFDLFGRSGLAAETVQLVLFLGAITGLVWIVARVVGVRVMAAGLVPIALGYLIAHYFTALAFDGQRIVAVISDPFNAGWNLFGTATTEASETWLPYGVVWAIELIAVVGGHIFGAIMGHQAAVMDAEWMPARQSAATAPSAAAPTTTGRQAARAGKASARSGRSRPAPTAPRSGLWSDVRARQVPLAILMVFLTTLTLWSLGQNLVHTPGEVGARIGSISRG